MRTLTRKIGLLLIIMLLASLWMVPVYGDTITLDDVAESVNNSDTVKDLKGFNIQVEAFSSLEDGEEAVRLFVTNPEGQTTVISFVADGNVIANEHVTADQVYYALILADAIGHLHGYEYGELYDTFNSDAAASYTVENEGFEAKENGSYFAIKMDISKKVPLVDLSDYYLTPDEFDTIKGIIDEGEVGNQSGRKAQYAYDVLVGNDESYITIGEEGEITDGTYKSILSALEVIYGDKVVEYFQEIYPEFREGGYVVDGFEIDYDAIVDTEEQPMFDGYKIVSVKVNNEFVNNEILRTEYIGETIDMGSKTLTLDFSKDGSYKIGFFDSARATDAGFLYKFILEPLAAESDVEADGNAVYFDVVDGKITMGSKDKSVFKVVIGEDSLEFLPTNPDAEKTTLTLKYDNLKAIQYEEGHSQDHYRYEEYDVTVNITYGKEKAAPTPTKPTDSKTDNTSGKTNSGTKPAATNVPKTGDESNGTLWMGFGIAAAILIAALVVTRKAHNRA